MVLRSPCSSQAWRARGALLEFSSEVKGFPRSFQGAKKPAQCPGSFLSISVVSCQHCLWGWDCARPSPQVERQSQVESPGLLTYMRQPRAEPWTRFSERCQGLIGRQPQMKTFKSRCDTNWAHANPVATKQTDERAQSEMDSGKRKGGRGEPPGQADEADFCYWLCPFPAVSLAGPAPSRASPFPCEVFSEAKVLCPAGGTEGRREFRGPSSALRQGVAEEGDGEPRSS